MLKDEPAPRCRATLYTAGRCLQELAKKMAGRKIVFQLGQGKGVTVESEKMEVFRPEGAVDALGYGLLQVTALCSHLKFLKPVTVTSLVAKGGTAHDPSCAKNPRGVSFDASGADWAKMKLSSFGDGLRPYFTPEPVTALCASPPEAVAEPPSMPADWLLRPDGQRA